MVFDNLPPQLPPEKPELTRTAETLQVEGHDLLRLTSASGQPETTYSTTIHPPDGGIAEITLGGQWKKLAPSPLPANISCERYKLEGTGSMVAIEHEYWRVSTNPDGQAAVLHLLSEPDHHLTQSEIDGIRLSLSTSEASAEDFNIQSAWTKHINGKPILFIEGDYKTEPGKGIDELSAYADSDPQRPGSLPERLTYLADTKGDPDNFKRHLPDVLKAMESMRWKEHTASDYKLPFIRN